MKKQKVFVLVKWGRVQNSETPLMEVVGVYSTKTAAKEKLAEERENIKAFFAERSTRARMWRSTERTTSRTGESKLRTAQCSKSY